MFLIAPKKNDGKLTKRNPEVHNKKYMHDDPFLAIKARTMQMLGAIGPDDII